jgi:hypothetical protein
MFLIHNFYPFLRTERGERRVARSPTAGRVELSGSHGPDSYPISIVWN